ncbi:MAG: cyclic nucleotide-binding domain-containing protein, partial [Proteobacteria bacterium]|nr:cyclic nucleotide-binding domain-containing protein [Pseudomonadota bacterium]
EDGEIIIKEGENDQWLYFLLEGKVRVSKDNCEITTISKKGEIFGEMRIIDTLSRSASIHAVGKTICLAVDTLAQSKIAGAGERDEKIDFLLLLYRIFAEYMSIRLRLTNEELVKARKQVERLKKSAQ